MNKYYKMLDFETIISKIAKNFKTKKGIELFQKSELYKDYEKSGCKSRPASALWKELGI